MKNTGSILKRENFSFSFQNQQFSHFGCFTYTILLLADIWIFAVLLLLMNLSLESAHLSYNWEICHYSWHWGQYAKGYRNYSHSGTSSKFAYFGVFGIVFKFILCCAKYHLHNYLAILHHEKTKNSPTHRRVASCLLVMSRYTFNSVLTVLMCLFS